MKRLFETFGRWRSWNEEDNLEDPNYLQERFIAYFVLSIAKGRGGDREETQNEIREIPGVTTVSMDTEISDSRTTYKGLFKVKFTLESQNKNEYVKNILLPEISKIEGLTVTSFKGVEQEA